MKYSLVFCNNPFCSQTLHVFSADLLKEANIPASRVFRQLTADETTALEQDKDPDAIAQEAEKELPESDRKMPADDFTGILKRVISTRFPDAHVEVVAVNGSADSNLSDSTFTGAGVTDEGDTYKSTEINSTDEPHVKPQPSIRHQEQVAQVELMQAQVRLTNAQAKKIELANALREKQLRQGF